MLAPMAPALFDDGFGEGGGGGQAAELLVRARGAAPHGPHHRPSGRQGGQGGD